MKEKTEIVKKTFDEEFLELRPAFVHNWGAEDVQISSFPIIIDSSNATVNSVIYEAIGPAVKAIGFFEKKPEFTTLAFISVMVPKQKTAHEIQIRTSKKYRMYNVDKTFHAQEVLDAVEKGYYCQFLVTDLFSRLKIVCEKFKLDASVLDSHKPAIEQIRKLCAKFNVDPNKFGKDIPNLPNQAGPGPAVSVSVAAEHNDESEEVILHVKLGSAFPTREETEENYQVFDTLEAILESENLGNLDASESGQGFQTAIFVGPNASKMVKAIRSILLELPTGSFLEIVKEGSSTRVEQSSL